MVSKGSDRFALWPRYFDRSLSRSQGRRVPQSLAVKGPDASWIEAVARKLGLDPEREEKARDPSDPATVAGRVLVKRKGSKEATVDLVAQKMRETQDAQQR